MFGTVTVHHQKEFCTSSLQYFTMHLKMSLVADTIQEDKLSKINYYVQCTSCWSFSHLCIKMHGSENVKLQWIKEVGWRVNLLDLTDFVYIYIYIYLNL